MIDRLPREDRLHLNAAEGWVGLGDAAEAMAELRAITEVSQRLPEVIEIYWSVYAEMKDWDSAWEMAERLVKACPEKCFGWVHRAFALRRMKSGGLAKAWDFLLPAAVRFPEEPIIPYNLACYCAQLNRLKEAEDWLRKAMEIGSPSVLRKMAMDDPDLEPLKVNGYFK